MNYALGHVWLAFVLKLLEGIRGFLCQVQLFKYFTYELKAHIHDHLDRVYKLECWNMQIAQICTSHEFFKYTRQRNTIIPCRNFVRNEEGPTILGSGRDFISLRK